ncbi:hypothetical protein ACP275_14G186100 [Erythranthe tilingii]
MLNQQQHEIESISRDLEVANQQNVQLRRALARIVRHFTDQFVQMRHSMHALTQRAWSAAQRGYVLASRSLGSDHRHLIESGTSTAANQANQTFGYRAAATDSKKTRRRTYPMELEVLDRPNDSFLHLLTPMCVVCIYICDDELVECTV